MTTERRYTLTISCPDRMGIVATVSKFIFGNHGWICEASHYADPVAKLFFMRHEIVADSLPFDLENFRSEFTRIAARFEMNWKISDSAQKKRAVILVSKQEHCLYDLLGRWHAGQFDAEIPCVISNHETFRGLVEWHGISFIHVPVTPDTKTQAFNEIARIFDEQRGDVMVLARYMQILPSALCERYPGKIINIHHSFLPSFVGAKPYHQAHERGVKHIGATCHYVTAELDQGPIIEQDVIRVDHTQEPDQMVSAGKDVEKAVLARGVQWHLQDRVLIHGKRTVVFK